MSQQALNLDVPSVYLARLFAQILHPWMHKVPDAVAIREMNAAIVESNINPLFIRDVKVSINDECTSGEFEVAVEFVHVGSGSRDLLYITNGDMELGLITEQEEFELMLNIHGRHLHDLIERSRGINVDQRMVSVAATNFQQGFLWLRDSANKREGF